MWRTILAIFAFNAYSLLLLSAFQENTAYLFDANLIEDMKLSGFDADPREWGWGSHYIWRLFSGVVTTAVAGVLAGAITKEGGARVTALANIPSVLVWSGMIYLFLSADLELENRTGFVVISIIAIPLTTYTAYLAGGLGEEIQRQEFPDYTVFGVKGYHWVWAIFPLYWYSLGIVYVGAKFVGFQFATWRDTSVFGSLLSLVLLIPIVAWLYPLGIVHRVLMGDILNKQNAAVRAMINFGILTFGMMIAAGVQFAVYWSLNAMLS